MKLTTILVVLLVSIPIALGDPVVEDGQTFECSEKATPISGQSGFLSIKKVLKSCGFKGSANFIAIGTTNLTLTNKDSVKLVSSNTASPEQTLHGPIEADYLGTGMFEELAFNFDAPDNSSMLLSFTTDPIMSIQGDRSRELLIQSFQVDSYNFRIDKTISQPLHVEMYGGSEPFGHYFIKPNETTKNILVVHPQPLLKVLTSPVTGDCSNTFTDESEAAHDVAGPQDISKAGQSFKCVNIFNLKLKTQQAHYDVSFANFMDISDNNDKLTISDGSSTLEITKSTARNYYQRKPVVSFEGQNLVVIYNSPQLSKQTFVSKLTVVANPTGGVIDHYGTLLLPAKGQARYALRPLDDSDASLVIKGKFEGADLRIFDDQLGWLPGGSDVTLRDGMSLPPEIILPRSAIYNLEVLNVKSQPGWSIDFKKSSSSCGGIFFKSSGTMNIEGGNKTCYWLLGIKSTVNIAKNDLSDPKSCLEIFSLTKQAPVFSKCSISPTEVLPSFIVGPGYVKVTTATTNTSNFRANILEPMTGLVASASSINSIGYPVVYPWYDTTDAQQLNATGKSMILSVNDLDLREGEKLVVDSKEIKSGKSDVDISNKTVRIEVQRSDTTKDYRLHRGVAMVVSEFGRIIVADVKNNKIVTPKNLTNILVKILAAPKARLSFNISEASDKVRLFDSPSLMGRQIVKDEMENATLMSGSTTSNNLLLWFKSDKALPEITVKFSQIPCNVTSDHVCDNDLRCIPASKMCKGKAYCEDGSDLRVVCSNGPAPPPRVVYSGLSGVTVSFLSLLMLALGSLATLYGPDLFKSLENRFRSGQYTTFSSTE